MLGEHLPLVEREQHDSQPVLLQNRSGNRGLRLDAYEIRDVGDLAHLHGVGRIMEIGGPGLLVGLLVVVTRMGAGARCAVAVAGMPLMVIVMLMVFARFPLLLLI